MVCYFEKEANKSTSGANCGAGAAGIDSQLAVVDEDNMGDDNLSDTDDETDLV